VLECLGLSLACGREGDDGDVMVVRLFRPALRLLPGAGCLHGRQLLFSRDVEIRFSVRIGGDARVVCLDPRTCRSQTCRARRRIVVRGGNLPCEAETGSSSGKLVGDVATWPKTGHLASEGLDEDLHASLRRSTR
jgi:hypothetical protein